MPRQLQELHSRLAQLPAAGMMRPLPVPLTIGTDAAPRALWQRCVTLMVAVAFWFSPLQITWQNARDAARLLGGAPVVRIAFGLPAAHAQVITDPAAPIHFTPTLTTSTGAGGGVPVVNITAPNANGISLNQYQQFNVDAIGLILNNSQSSGSALLGGTVAANPNLTAAGAHPARLIVNQVTSQSTPSAINGTIEVFGQQAGIVIANPNGITCTGCGFVNTSGVTLTTGVPQWLDASGNSSTFDNAANAAWNVQGGHVQIEGLSGSSGTPGSGIEGTVGQIDLIAETIGVDAALYANNINLVAGRQLVTPNGSGSYAVTPNGPNDATTNTSAATTSTPSLQIDATAYGAMTAGQITIIGTAQGLGVRTDASLAANAGQLVISANGDIQTANAYGSSVAISTPGRYTNTGIVTSAGTNAVSAGTLVNNGILYSDTALNITAGTAFDNSNGAFLSGGDLTLNLPGQTFDPLAAINGVIAQNGTLNINAQTIANSGTWNSPGSGLALNAVGDINNSGTISNAGDISLNAGGTLNNVGGAIAAGGNLGITATTVNNDRAVPVTTTTVSTVINDGLLLSTVVGSGRQTDITNCGDNGCAVTMVGVALSDLDPDMSARTITLWQGPYDSDAGLPTLVFMSAADATTAVTNGSAFYGSSSVALPQVKETIQQQANGNGSSMVAGGNLTVTAGTLSNRGSVISGGGNVTLNLGTLNNGYSDSLNNWTVDAVDQAGLNAFMGQLNAALYSYGVIYSIFGSGYTYASTLSSPTTYLSAIAIGTSASAPSTTLNSSTILGIRGQILSGGNLALNGTGSLVNAGDIAAAGNIGINLPGTFTNQGLNQSYTTTSGGCQGSPQSCAEGNAHNDSYNQSFLFNTVAAGGSLTINAGAIQNNYGTVAARGDVNLTAGSVTNTAGAIQSLNGNVNIAASQITNTVISPVWLHQSYGNVSPWYAPGCNPGNITYKDSQCEANIQAAASPAGIISAGGNVNLTGDNLTNSGSLITGINTTVNMTNGVNNSAVPLNASWYGHWVEHTSWWEDDNTHPTGGTSAIGNENSGIEASQTLSVSAGGTVLNTGNLYGNSVSLTGSALVNGYTSPSQPTPPANTPQQVISLGPTGTPVNPNTTAPAALPGTATTTPTTTTGIQYVVTSAATSVLGGIGPSTLLSELPSSLQPATSIPFYDDPYTQAQALAQAALQQTGQSTFLTGLNPDAQQSLSDQQMAILYQNAAAWAAANNVQLGTALTQTQINALSAPMLWYVEETVPDPNCTGTTCGTIVALVPQLYLPSTNGGSFNGGMIAGQNTDLDFSDSIHNTGIVSADTLNVSTASLTNEQRSVDIGTSSYRVDKGWITETGTQLAQGGFMQAATLNIDASNVTSIGAGLKILNADGTENTQATQQLLADLSNKLGANFQQLLAQDNIHIDFTAESHGGLGPIGTMVVAIVAAIVTAGAASELILANAAEAASAAAMAAGATSEVSAMAAIAAIDTAAASWTTVAMAAAAGSMASSAVMQISMTGSLDLGGLLTAGVSGAISGGVAGYFGSTYDATRLLATTASGCVTAAISGGNCGSGAESGFISGSLAWAGNLMRQNQIASSEQFKGVTDYSSGETVTNTSGPSAGIDGDGIKLAGTRPSLSQLQQYGTVTVNDNGSWTFVENPNVTMGLDPTTNQAWTLDGALNKLGGLTGGAQGLQGTLFSYTYSAGGFVDKLLESYAGPHDFLGSLTGYDSVGNLSNMNQVQQALFSAQTDVDLLLATPFAAATLLNQYGLSAQIFSSQYKQVEQKQ